MLCTWRLVSLPFGWINHWVSRYLFDECLKFEPELVPNLGEVAAPRRRAAIVDTTPYDPNSLCTCT